MARRPRFDRPGRLHHIMNRGIARRTVFEHEEDVRYFLSLLAREVRAGRLRVYAFSILTTHFHLLASSPEGDISGSMQRVLNRYVRFFNRTRKRDGSLFRGRFLSRPVVTTRYRFTATRYIDQNAPQARLASTATAYPYASASLYAAKRRPRWLDTAWVDTLLGDPPPEERAARYAQVFGPPLGREERELVVARIRSPASVDDELDDLIGAAPAAVLQWMRRKAALADQTKPGLPLVGASKLLERVRDAERDRPDWTCVPGSQQARSAWPILRVGLLRVLGGMTFQQIAKALGLGQSAAQTRAKQHARLIEDDAAYAALAASVAGSCLADEPSS